jgi:hypothetical protein
MFSLPTTGWLPLKKYSVSIDVVSAEIRLDELNALLGNGATSGSHDVGDRRGQGTWDQTIWRWDSTAPESAPLDAHLESVASFLPGLKVDRLPSECRVFCSIAVFFDTPMATVLLPPQLMQAIARHGVTIEVASYPCEEDARAAPPS